MTTYSPDNRTCWLLICGIVAGIFVTDPANGFPPGTPESASAFILPGLLHFAVGGLGFLALIAGCFVFARHFMTLGKRNWAAYSGITGVLFLVAFMGVASGSTQPGDGVN